MMDINLFRVLLSTMFSKMSTLQPVLESAFLISMFHTLMNMILVSPPKQFGVESL